MLQPYIPILLLIAFVVVNAIVMLGVVAPPFDLPPDPRQDRPV